jgi:hypothetical protein
LVEFLIDDAGTEHPRYRISKSMLCRVSNVFHAMTRINWSIEEKKSVVKIPKDETDVWVIFFHWLRVPGVDLDKELTYSSGTYGIKCVVFADKYDIPTFHDMAITSLYASKCIFPIRLVKLAYETRPRNPVRKFVIQRIVHAKGFDVSRVSKWEDLDGKGFLMDIMKELASISHRVPMTRQQRVNRDILKHSLYGVRKSSTERPAGFMGLLPDPEHSELRQYRGHLRHQRF